MSVAEETRWIATMAILLAGLLLVGIGAHMQADGANERASDWVIRLGVIAAAFAYLGRP